MDVDGRDDLWVMLGGDMARPIRGFYVFDHAWTLSGGSARAIQVRHAFVSWAGDRVAIEDTDENDLPRIRIFRIDRRGH